MGDALWDDGASPPLAPSMPVLHLEGFDGPMDLLLDLAERQRIDLGRLSIQALAEQFVAAMERLAEKVPIERRADWLVVATRLVLLRSRLLFSKDPQAAASAERDAATELRRLDEKAFIRAAAAMLAARPPLGIDVFARPQPEPPKPEGGYVALMEACLVALRGGTAPPGEATPACRPALPDLWRVADALARIRAMLAARPEGGGLARFLPAVPPEGPHRSLRARAALASTLVAALELAREGAATVTQGKTFGRIRLQATAAESDSREQGTGSG